MAAFGSFLGLVAGGVAGNALTKVGGQSRESKMGTLVVSSILGTAIGAFAGAALASPKTSTQCTSVTGS